MTLNWNFQRGGGGVIGEIPSVGGMDIFWNCTFYNIMRNPEDNYIAEGSNYILCSLFLAHRNRNNKIYLQKQ